jgi:hypothetical protein
MVKLNAMRLDLTISLAKNITQLLNAKKAQIIPP